MNFCVGASAGAVANMKSLPGSHAPSVVMCSSHWWKPSPKSKPPQNDRPAPRRIMTLTRSSRTAALTAASISSGIGGTIVFSASGRFSVIVAIASSTVYSSVW